MKTILLIATLFVAWGLVGHTDEKTQLLTAMVNTCEQSGGTTLTPDGQECNNLIQEVQSRYNVEVLSDATGSRFWVENK